MSAYWVSRSPCGGWVWFASEAAYREVSERDPSYCEGRPATECEASFAASLHKLSAEAG
jgi:hypothetical protein